MTRVQHPKKGGYHLQNRLIHSGQSCSHHWAIYKRARLLAIIAYSSRRQKFLCISMGGGMPIIEPVTNSMSFKNRKRLDRMGLRKDMEDIANQQEASAHKWDWITWDTGGHREQPYEKTGGHDVWPQT